ncbi:MAG TPA: hypothetical protein VEI53_00350 [Ktedonobacteraceae bacterium]|nr:hypothetical protein [Ktedonobacteraceae bacterium]
MRQVLWQRVRFDLPLPSAFQQLGSSLTSAHCLFALVDAEPAVCDPVLPAPIPAHYNLDVSNLCFRYQPDNPHVLDDVSFSLPERRCVALIGPSGAGKSPPLTSTLSPVRQS